MVSKSGFSARLTGFRKQRGWSQLQLAMSARCSQRHVSFLELGRTQPSREMVQRLSMTLGLSLRQSNELLLAAGYMSEFTNFSPNHPKFGAYDEVLWRLLGAVEAGQMQPKQAVDVAVGELQAQLKDDLIVK